MFTLLSVLTWICMQVCLFLYHGINWQRFPAEWRSACLNRPSRCHSEHRFCESTDTKSTMKCSSLFNNPSLKSDMKNESILLLFHTTKTRLTNAHASINSGSTDSQSRYSQSEPFHFRHSYLLSLMSLVSLTLLPFEGKKNWFDS